MPLVLRLGAFKLIIMNFLLVYILLIHFLADFGLQTHDQATKKSTDNWFLFMHVGTYSLIWCIATMPFSGTSPAWLLFGSVTFVTHFVTDFITSRIGKPFWDKQDFHNGFVVVGFDQMLHYLHLYFTFKLLF